MPVISGNDPFPAKAWKPVKGLTGVYRADLFTGHLLTLTDFSEGDGVKDLTGAAEEAILSGWLGKVSRSRAPAGAGGLPHVPYHTCASLP